MAILIKGMEMPSKGCKTINLHADGTVYVHGAYPTELYKAIPVPTPHGRLIDADELLTDANKLRYGEGWLITVENIEHTPTIIEAEEGQE